MVFRIIPLMKEVAGIEANRLHNSLLNVMTLGWLAHKYRILLFKI